MPGTPRPAWLRNQPTPAVQKLWLGTVAAGAAILSVFGLITVAAMLST